MQIKENAFLSPSQKLSKEEERITPLRKNEDKTIEASPWTWMETKWENRKIIKKIWFEWDGEMFVKYIKDI